MRLRNIIFSLCICLATFKGVFAQTSPAQLNFNNLVEITALNVSQLELLTTYQNDELPITSVAFNHADNLIAAASDDTIIVWDLETDELLHTLTGHSDVITDVVFHPSEDILFSSSFDGNVIVWNARTGSQIRTLSGHNNLVTDLAVNTQRRVLASASVDQSVRLWDLSTYEQIAVLNNTVQIPLSGGEGIGIVSIAFSLDGNLLAAGTGANYVLLYDVTSHEILYQTEWTNVEALVENVVISPSNEELVSSIQSDIYFRNLTSGETNHLLPSEGYILTLDFCHDGSLIAYGGYTTSALAVRPDSYLYIIDSTSKEELLRLGGHRYRVNKIVFNHGGTILASADDEGVIRLWGVISN